MNGKLRRITVTALHEPNSAFWESRGVNFRPVAMPDLGYGSQGYTGTEATYFESVAWLIERAKEEGSRVFILGFGPRRVPSTWIKTAELIAQGSEVKAVLVPLCRIVSDGNNPVVSGTIIYVEKIGITKAESLGEMPVDDFFKKVAADAKFLSDKYGMIQKLG